MGKSLVLIVAIVLAATGMGQPAAAADAYQLRFGTYLPPGSQLVKNGFIPWSDSLRRESGSRLDIQVYPGGTLGKNPSAQLKLMKDGILDITFIIPSYFPGEFPDNEVVELPLTADNAVDASRALWGMYEKGLLRGYEDMKVVALGTTPTYNLHLTFDYTGIESLRGKKIRVSTKVQQRIVEELGATPVGNIVVTELAESLSRGVIDGTLLAWDAVRLFRVTPTVKHHVVVPLGFTPLAVIMNKSKYDSMPTDLKAKFDRSIGPPLVADFARIFESDAHSALEETQKAGANKVTIVENQAMAQWRAKLAPVAQSWPGTPERKKLYQGLLAELEAQKKAGKPAN